MRRMWIGGVLALAFCLILAGTAKADNLHLCDVNAVCNSGSVIKIPSANTTDFVNGTSYAGGTLYLLALTPVAGSSGQWNGGNLWSGVLGSAVQNYPTLASAISQENGATGLTPGSFNFQSISQGAWSGSATITLPSGEPVGTIYMAYVLDAQGNLVAVTPWSSSLINVPEPSIMILLGVGLLGLCGLAARKLFSA